MSLLEVRGLSVAFPAGLAVRSLSFALAPGERVGIVGESGSGKTMTALAILGMQPEAARVTGRVALGGTPLDPGDERAMAGVRGRRVGMVFQDPAAALNPLHRIGRQIAEPLLWHGLASRAEAEARAVALLSEVGLPEPARRLRQYPHELSGGQRQRATIAMALACGPELLIADEPSSALDVAVAARVLDLLRDLSERRGMGLLVVSHDLAAIARVAQRILVLYCGDLVEEGPVAEVLSAPAHPYTQGLLAARPRLRRPGEPARPLPTIPGRIPPLSAMGAGCRFHGRCPLGTPDCAAAPPPLRPVGPGRQAACFRIGEGP